MADKYINETGLLTIRNWANGKFALDADLDALDARVDDIIAEGGEPNTIESISVNGSSVTPDAQKNVALTIPTATSDLTNDSNFAVDANYVHTDNNYTTAEKTKLGGVETGAEANVIETVKVDGVALTPDAQKAVNIDLDSYLAPYAGFETDTDSIGLANNDYSISFTKNSDNTVTLESSEMTPAPSPLATVAYVAANGGKIDSISVNGTPQTIDANKNVDLSIPEEVFYATYGTTTYSDLLEAVNNKAAIYVNGLPILHASKGGDQSIYLDYLIRTSPSGPHYDTYSVSTSNEWNTYSIIGLAKDSDLPKAVSELTNDANYQTDTQVDSKIASAVASAVTLKGSVATYSALPSTGQKHGDMYDVLDTGKNYVWIVEEGTGRWDDYAGTMDMSAYWTSTAGQTNTLEAMTVAEVNAILEPSA